jgi:hypothetical protein
MPDSMCHANFIGVNSGLAQIGKNAMHGAENV